MRIAREVLTVVAHPPRREVDVILSGLRITLEVAEAQGLRRHLAAALERVAAGGRPAAKAPAPAASADEAV